MSCTTPIVRDTTAIDDITCETVECVVDAMDSLPQDSKDARYLWMEGMPDANLRKMLNEGSLDIDIINPLWLLTLTYGYAYLESKPYGGMKKCVVRYVPGLNWLSLKHELSHCQGYEDHGIPLQLGDYTDEQKHIMKQEGVSRWIDTSTYKMLKDRNFQ